MATRAQGLVQQRGGWPASTSVSPGLLLTCWLTRPDSDLPGRCVSRPVSGLPAPRASSGMFLPLSETTEESSTLR